MLGDLGLGGTPEIDILVKAIDQTQGAFGSVGSGLGILAAAAAAATAAIVAVGSAIVQVTKVTLDWGQSLNDTKMKLGSTAQQAAGLQLAADAVGVSIDTVTARMMMLEKGLVTATGKIGASGTELKNLGINYKNANGTLMDSTTLLQSVADWFVKTTDVTQRNNAEMTIFGRGGADLDRMLTNLAGGGMQEYINQASKMGLVMSDEQLAQIEKLNEQMNILQDAFKGAEITLGVTFLPVLQSLVTWFQNLLAAEMPAIQQFAQFLESLFGISIPGLTSKANSSKSGGGAYEAVYTGGSSPADQAWRDYWNGKGPRPTPGMAGGASPATGSAAIPEKDTPLEAAIRSMVTTIEGLYTDITKLDWGKFGNDINVFSTGVVDAVNAVYDTIKDATTTQPGHNFGGGTDTGETGGWQTIIKGLLMNNTAGNKLIADELAREWKYDIIDPLSIKMGDEIKNAWKSITMYFQTSLTLWENSIGGFGTQINNTFTDFSVKLAEGLNKIYYVLGIKLIDLSSLENSIPVTGSNAGNLNNPNFRAGGGFVGSGGWAMVGDAPGGRATRYSEMIHARPGGGVDVYNQSQMPGMAGGGYLPAGTTNNWNISAPSPLQAAAAVNRTLLELNYLGIPK
jgi:hypothetical protein